VNTPACIGSCRPTARDDDDDDDVARVGDARRDARDLETWRRSCVVARRRRRLDGDARDATRGDDDDDARARCGDRSLERDDDDDGDDDDDATMVDDDDGLVEDHGGADGVRQG